MSVSEGLARGHQRAEDAAERAGKEWRDAAYTAFVGYAMTHQLFTMEDVRDHAAHLRKPPDPRAWGAIARRALREGIVEHHGYDRAKSPTVHGQLVRVWRSKVC